MWSFSADCVTRHIDHFHPVQKRTRNGIERVRSRDEEHFRQIKRHVEVMIQEVRVLLGIKDLKQCARGIAGEASRKLVDFIENEDRVLFSRALDSLDDSPGIAPM